MEAFNGVFALTPGPGAVKKLNWTSLTDDGFESTAGNARGGAFHLVERALLRTLLAGKS